MKIRNLIIVVIVLALAAAGYYYLRQRQASSAGVASLQTTQVTRGPLVASVNAAGTIASPQTATLAWQASGIVGTVNVSVGEVVKTGDVLMELDPNSLGHTYLQAQADLLSAQHDLATLKAGPTEKEQADAKLAIIQATQAITTAKQNLTSVLNPVGQSLFDAVTSAQLAYDTAQTNQQLEQVSADATAVQTAQNNLNQALSRLQSAQADYDSCLSNSCAELSRRENALTGAQNSYQSALNAFQLAQLTYNSKISNLNYAGDTSKTALDKAKANLVAARAGPNPDRVLLYQAQLDVANANLAQANDDLATLHADPDPVQVAEANARIAAAQEVLDSPKLVAPFSGTIAAIDTLVGDSVSNSQTAVVIADLSSFQVVVSVAEVDLSLIAVGQDVELTADAAPGLTFNGKVADVSILGQSQQGVVTFPVKIVIPNPDPALRPGMTAAIAIVTDRHEVALLVPNRAIRVSAGQRSVVVLFEGNQISVPITIGLTNDTESEVLEGSSLREGDTLVLNSSSTTANAGGGFLFGGGGGGFGP